MQQYPQTAKGWARCPPRHHGLKRTPYGLKAPILGQKAVPYSNSSVTGHEAAGFLSVAWQPPTPPTKNPVTFTV